MGILITVLFFATILFVICLFIYDDTDGDSLFIQIACVGVSILVINCKTTSYDKPIEVPKSKISIMVDDEVAIIRYGDVMETYDNVKKYKAIKDSSFKFMETKERNVFGEDNGSTYELIIK